VQIGLRNEATMLEQKASEEAKCESPRLPGAPICGRLDDRLSGSLGSSAPKELAKLRHATSQAPFDGAQVQPRAQLRRQVAHGKSLPFPPVSLHIGQVNFRGKIVPWDKLAEWRAAQRASGRKLVVTNGCFDLLHLGHVTYLESARNQGDALLVGLNNDESARQLKGPHRPVNGEHDRAAVLAALESVDGVCLFGERTATRFLAAAEPDVYVKGGDYTLDTLNQEERRTVEQAGGKILILPLVPGKSTTKLLETISRL